jgi:hypothetical protein
MLPPTWFAQGNGGGAILLNALRVTHERFQCHANQPLVITLQRLGSISIHICRASIVTLGCRRICTVHLYMLLIWSVIIYCDVSNATYDARNEQKDAVCDCYRHHRKKKNNRDKDSWRQPSVTISTSGLG